MSKRSDRPRNLIERTRKHSEALRPSVKGDHWIAADLGASGWDNRAGFAPAAYQRREGTVMLRGVIEGGAGGAVIMTLPPGLRPQFATLLGTVVEGPAAGYLTVDVDGTVTAHPGSGSWISLDGLSFRAYA